MADLGRVTDDGRVDHDVDLDLALVLTLQGRGDAVQVGVGQYLGQNFGRVMKISEHEIALREIVQDAAGDWVERPVTLQLQEETRK